MCKFLKSIIFSSVFIPYLCFASDIVDTNRFKNKIQEVQLAIKSSIAKSEELFAKRHGKMMKHDINMLVSTLKENPFFELLKIESDYEIRIEFKKPLTVAFIATSFGIDFTEDYTNSNMRDIKIRLIPVYNLKNQKINSWDCITDADSSVDMNLVSTKKSTGNLSFISNNNNIEYGNYIRRCIFIDEVDIFNL
jgi:hypothetical protein